MAEKEAQQGKEFIKWFSELNKSSGNIAGGKGANLAEIYNLKIPVPPGFVVTVQAYNDFIEKSGINDKIEELLGKIEYENTLQLEEITQAIRNLIIHSKMSQELEEEIIEAYENLDVEDSNSEEKEEKEEKTPLDILETTSEPIFVAVRSSATSEDLPGASFAGQQETFLNVRGNDDLLANIKKCFASLFTARATYYRNKKGFKHEESRLAVIVQKMINADKSGVIFSKDPSFKNENMIIEAVFGLGEGIVSGKITPDRYIVSKDLKILEKEISDKKIALTRDSEGKKIEVKLSNEKSKARVLKKFEINKLSEFALKLEDHYHKPQDIEFAIEGEGIYIVQTRAITTLEKRVEKGSLKEIKGEIILKGLGASPGIAFGRIKIIKNLSDLNKISKGDILVTKMTNPDMVVTMQKSVAIVTDEGGLTAHAAIVSREMGIPAVVGTREATIKLKEGEIITVNGYNGEIYKGKTSEIEKKEVLPVTARTKTKIKLILDLPSFAGRAAKTGLTDIGLLRIEGIIAESGKHPNYFLEKNQMKDYEGLIYKGVNEIAKHFENLWVRTSDIRSDEFKNLEGAPKRVEKNPMLGMHGIRFGLKEPEILKAEIKALQKITEKGKGVGLLLPQVISVEEVRKVKELLKEMDFHKLKVGVMIETPASVQLIKELCDEGIDFVSFGTNDLTQYILAVDRGNELVQYIFNEMNPAVLYQLEFVIRICKRNNVEISICGQAGSRKEMVKFLVERGIDSISVNADVAAEIAEYISELERKMENESEKAPLLTAVESAEEISDTKLEKEEEEIFEEQPYDDVPLEDFQESEETETEEDKDTLNIF